MIKPDYCKQKFKTITPLTFAKKGVHISLQNTSSDSLNPASSNSILFTHKKTLRKKSFAFLRAKNSLSFCAFLNFIIISLIFIFVLTLVTNSGITGLVVVDVPENKTIGIIFNSSGELLLSLSGSPSQITLTGEHNGKVEIEIDGHPFYKGNTTKQFSHTENFTSLTENITIEIKLDNSTLTLDKLDYVYQEEIEEPEPYWNSNITKFNITSGEILEIELNDYFVDDDNLTYLATGASNISVEVYNSLLRVIPDLGFAGERTIKAIASDEYYVVQQELKIEVIANITEINITEINVTEENITEENISVNISARTYSEEEKIKIKNKTLGKKIEDEKEYEVYFTNMTYTNSSFIIEFYHDNIIPLPVFVSGNVSYNLSFFRNESLNISNNIALTNETVKLSVDLIEEILPKFELHVGITSEVFEFGKIIPKIKKKKGKYKLIDRDDEFLDVKVYTNDTNIIISKTNATSINSTIDYVNDSVIKTEVIALDNISMSNATVKMNKKGRINTILKCLDIDMETLECYSGWILTDIPYSDDGENITFVVNSFSGYSGGYIEILNVQSYPTVGGEWKVSFNTTGTANLSITAIQGTTWSSNGNNTDLQFLTIFCGNKSVNYSWINNTVSIPDYNCSSLGYETSKVITPGTHHLEFRFGNSTAYAHNLAALMNETGLVGHWTFDAKDGSNSTNATDISGEGNDGTVTGATFTNEGRFKEGYEFDGDDAISAGDVADFDKQFTDFTASAWIKVPTISFPATESFFLGKMGATGQRGWQISIVNSSKVISVTYFNSSSGSSSGISSTTTVNANTWYHIAFVFNSTNEQIYINGAINKDEASLNLINGNNTAYQGIGSRGTANYFHGTIDEVRIYNRSLSASEVADLYNGTKSHYLVLKSDPTLGLNDESGLVGYWTFDSKEGSNSATAVDSSGQGNNCTAYNSLIFTNEGRFKEAYDYKAVDEAHLRCGTGIWNNTQNYSISAWIYPKSFGTGVTQFQMFIGKGNFATTLGSVGDTTGEISLRLYNTTNSLYDFVSSANLISINEWAHIGITIKTNRTTTNVSFYKNGVLDDSEVKTNFLLRDNTVNQLYLGTWFDSSYWFNGTIDEVRIYNRSLSASEVADLYNGTKSNYLVLKSDPTLGLDDETGLIAYWTMDTKDGSNSSNCTDVSGQENNGAVTGALLTNEGRFKEAYEFDATSDYFTANSLKNKILNQSGAVSLWANARTISSNRYIFADWHYTSPYQKWFMYVRETDKLCWTLGNPANGNCAENITGIDTDTWYHFALVWDAGEYWFYKDGAKVKNGTYSGWTMSAWPYDVTFGAYTDKSSKWDGYLDEFRIYNRSLSASEVADLYNGTKSNKIVLWSMPA